MGDSSFVAAGSAISRGSSREPYIEREKGGEGVCSGGSFAMDSGALLLPAGLVAFDNSLKKQQQQQKPLTVAAADAAGSSFADIFQIDDLLDFSNEDIAGPIGEAVHHTPVLKPETIGGCLTPFLENGTELQHLAPKAHKLEGEEEEAGIEADLCLPVSQEPHTHLHKQTHATFALLTF